MAPATQCFSSLHPTTVSGGAAQKCSAQSQSPAPRWGILRLCAPASSTCHAQMALIVKFHAFAFGFHRRATTPALNEPGEKQGDHIYLSGAPHAHLPLATLHPPATEESPGSSGEINRLSQHCYYRKKQQFTCPHKEIFLSEWMWAKWSILHSSLYYFWSDFWFSCLLFLLSICYNNLTQIFYVDVALQQERAARERELDYQPRKVNWDLSVCLDFHATRHSTQHQTGNCLLCMGLTGMFGLQCSFLSFWKGEDCERNGDSDHSEKSKKFTKHLVRKVNLIWFDFGDVFML